MESRVLCDVYFHNCILNYLECILSMTPSHTAGDIDTDNWKHPLRKTRYRKVSNISGT